MVSKSKTRESIDLNVPYLVYHITSPLSKSNGYVGITKLPSVEERLEKHFSHMVEDLRQFELGKIHRVRTVLKALAKYGRENIQIRQIDSCLGLLTACELEKKYISELDTFKRGWNETAGGEGQPAYTPDAKTREKISKANTGRKRTAEVVEANRVRGSDLARKLNASNPPRKTKPCIIDGIEFKSKKDAAEHFGANQDQLEKMIKSGKSDIYEDKRVVVYGVTYKNQYTAQKELGWSKQNFYNYKLFGEPRIPKGIIPEFIVKGVKFTSYSAISEHFGVSKTTAMYLAAGGEIDPKKYAKKVSLFGTEYPTKDAACKALGISKPPLDALLEGKKIPRTWAIYKYGDLYFSSENAFKRLTGLSSWYFREYLENGKIEYVYDEHIKYNMSIGEKL